MYLTATAETPNSAPAAAPRISPSARGWTWRRAEILTSAAPLASALRVVGAAAGQTDHHEPGGGHRQADPLSPAQLKAEEALGEHGQEDEPAGQDRLHDRQRRE
jgi:hypothetical protein